MSINLEAPPGFRGFDPSLELKVYHRNMPHWRQKGATCFVTFNLADALPGAKKNELLTMRRVWENKKPPPRDEANWTEYGKLVFRKVERWLDTGYGKCWFRNAAYAAELNRAILHFQDKRYEIGCFVIMGNHCHLVIRPFDGFELESEVGAIKEVSAKFINRKESRRGQLWQPESYDRIIRDVEHLYRVVQYIGANPRKAGISVEDWYRWVNPRWEAIGWGFRDS